MLFWKYRVDEKIKKRNHTLSKDKLAEFKETQKDDKKKHALHCSLKIYKNERHQLVLKEKKRPRNLQTF